MAPPNKALVEIHLKSLRDAIHGYASLCELVGKQLHQRRSVSGISQESIDYTNEVCEEFHQRAAHVRESAISFIAIAGKLELPSTTEVAKAPAALASDVNFHGRLISELEHAEALLLRGGRGKSKRTKCVSVREAAAAIGVDVGTIRKWCQPLGRWGGKARKNPRTDSWEIPEATVRAEQAK